MGIDENDSYWTREDLLPPVKKNKYQITESKDTDTVEIELEVYGETKSLRYPPITTVPEQGEKPDFDKWLKERDKYFEAKRKSNVVKEYVPENNPLLKKVSIAVPTLFSPSSERFVRDGEKLYDREKEFSGNVSYRSVYPQYAQLSENQLDCYIGFRSMLRKGMYPEVDEAYKYLYLYELINLTSKMTPSERACRMAEFICGYPESGEALMKDVCSWLADICLIYQLPVPSVIYGSDVYRRVLENAPMPEIYTESDSRETENSVAKLISLSGGYDFRKSKYYAGYGEIYDKYIERAVVKELAELLKSDKKIQNELTQTCKISRESFYGAYRTSAVKRIITCECVLVTRSSLIRKTVSDITRYAENCLRGRLGIKQTLTVSGIGAEVKQSIRKNIEEMTSSEPFASVNKTVLKKPEIPDYEKLYMPASEKFTPEKAGEIEKNSWQITERLVSAFEQEDENVYPENIVGKTDDPDRNAKPSADSDDFWLKALKAVLVGDKAEYYKLCKESNMLGDAMADMLNERLTDIIGDVAVIADGDFYVISEWYTDEISELTCGIPQDKGEE